MLTLFTAGYNFLKARFPREEGAVATEYGLLLFLVALAIIIALGALGTALYNIFQHSANVLSGTG